MAIISKPGAAKPMGNVLPCVENSRGSGPAAAEADTLGAVGLFRFHKLVRQMVTVD